MKFLLAILILCAQSFAAIAYVNGGHTVNGGTSCAVTLSVTSGNALLFAITSNSAGTTQGVSDSSSNTYTNIYANDSQGGVITSIWLGQMGSTNASLVVTETNSSGANNEMCTASQYSGMATAASAVDKKASGAYSAVTTLPAGTTAATTQAVEMIIGVFACTGSNGGTFTAGSGYTLRDNQGYVSSLAVEEKAVSSTGTQQATLTSSASSTGGGYTITFVPPGAAGVKRHRGAVIGQ